MSFIVIAGQLVGGQGQPFETVWSSDMVEKRTRKEAIRYGLRIVGSDDFRIGQLRGEWLKSVQWMNDAPFGPDEVCEIAGQLGLRNYWDDPDDGLGVGWGA